MKTIFFSLLILTLIKPSVFAQKAEDIPFEKLKWLEGKWERMMENPNQTGYEDWKIKNGSFQGMGVTIQQGDTVFVEKLSIERMEGDWYYIADVNPNVEPTYFMISEISENGFVSENPDHDFPKKIEYQLKNDGELSVVISGDGRSIPFVFRKV